MREALRLLALLTDPELFPPRVFCALFEACEAVRFVVALEDFEARPDDADALRLGASPDDERADALVLARVRYVLSSLAIRLRALRFLQLLMCNQYIIYGRAESEAQPNVNTPDTP